MINFHRLKIYFGEVLDQGSLNPHIASLSAAILACGRLKLGATLMGDSKSGPFLGKGKKWEWQVLDHSKSSLLHFRAKIRKSEEEMRHPGP